MREYFARLVLVDMKSEKVMNLTDNICLQEVKVTLHFCLVFFKIFSEAMPNLNKATDR